MTVVLRLHVALADLVLDLVLAHYERIQTADHPEQVADGVPVLEDVRDVGGGHVGPDHRLEERCRSGVVRCRDVRLEAVAGPDHRVLVDEIQFWKPFIGLLLQQRDHVVQRGGPSRGCVGDMQADYHARPPLSRASCLASGDLFSSRSLHMSSSASTFARNAALSGWVSILPRMSPLSSESNASILS